VKGGDGSIAASTVNWVTQTSFNPPLLAICVKTDSGAYAALKTNKQFALNVLGKGQQKAAFAFFKPAKVEGNTLSGEPFTAGSNGAPILTNAPAAVECQIVQIVEHGDHHTVVAEVTNAYLPKPLDGRPDAAVLEMKDLGDTVFYGG
jgi:flavin reductase (DIM6/NTAB) family NADH-FMN oxidoreductase RutF